MQNMPFPPLEILVKVYSNIAMASTMLGELFCAPLESSRVAKHCFVERTSLLSITTLDLRKMSACDNKNMVTWVRYSTAVKAHIA